MADPRIPSGTPRPATVASRATPASMAASSPAVVGDGGGVSEVARVLAALRGNRGLERVTAAQWQSVFRTLDRATDSQLQAISRSLLKQGLLVKVQQYAGLISLFGEQGAVSWTASGAGQPGSGTLRV